MPGNRRQSRTAWHFEGEDIDIERVRETTSRTDAALDCFDGTGVSLGDLSFVLKASLDHLQTTGAQGEWIDELRSLRNQLEFTYAFFVESGRDQLNEHEIVEVNETLDELRAALAPY